MIEPVMRLTDRGRNALLELVRSKPDLWKDPGTDFEAALNELGVDDFAEETPIVSDGPIQLRVGRQYGRAERHKMDRNAPEFCDLLQGMSASQAADGQIWEWLTHFRLHRYACERWPQIQNNNLVEYIQLHWFVRNNSRDLYQNNTASRTFWLGTMAERISGASQGALTRQQVAEFFSDNPVIYHNTLQSSMTNNPRISAKVIEALTTPERGKGISSRGSIKFWKELNLSAGKVLPEALNDHEWRILIDRHLATTMTEGDYVRDSRYLRGVEPYRVLSLGAGVQSTVLALMADRGEFGLPKPDVAIFADTQWEPKAVYEHIEWLKRELSFEVRVVTAGNIKENLRKGIMPDSSRFIGMPIYLLKDNGQNGATRRQCTTQYKVNPIHKELRAIWGLSPRQPFPRHARIEMWIGISVDEIMRAKPTRENHIDKRFSPD